MQMNRRDLLLKKRKAPEKRQKRGCCGSTELPIVVARRSWREISCGKLGTLIQQTKTSLNFVSTCLKVVDTRRTAVRIKFDWHCSLTKFLSFCFESAARRGSHWHCFQSFSALHCGSRPSEHEGPPGFHEPAHHRPGGDARADCQLANRKAYAIWNNPCSDPIRFLERSSGVEVDVWHD